MTDARMTFERRMNWLNGNQIGISQRAEEFFEVWEQVYNLKPSRFLEVGSHTGGSLYMYAAACEFPATIICIDKPFAPAPRTKQLKFIIGKLREEGHEVTHFSGDSMNPDFIGAAHDLMPVADFVHIDGCHDYEYARADWDNYGVLARAGGLVALHDLEMRRREGEVQPGVGTLYTELMDKGYAYTGTRHVQYKNLGKVKVAGIGLIHVAERPEPDANAFCAKCNDRGTYEDGTSDCGEYVNYTRCDEPGCADNLKAKALRKGIGLEN